MSTLTSSAFGGSKAKPKAPPRRRAAPVAAPVDVAQQQVDAAQPQESGDSASAGAQPDLQPNAQPTLAPPSPPVVVERPARGSGEHQQSVTEGPQDNDEQSNSTANTGQRNTRKRGRETARHVEQGSNKRARPSEEAADNIVEPSDRTTTAAAASPVIDNAVTSGPRTRAGRTRKASQRQLEADEDSQNTSARPRRKPRAKKPAQGATSGEPPAHDTANTDDSTAPPRPTKARKPRKKRNAAAIVVEADGLPVDEGAADDNPDEPVTDDDHESHKSEEKDPEEHEIDPKTLSMYELTHQTKYGKISEREKKMAQIDWDAVKQKRIEEAEAIARGELQKNKDGDVVQSTENADDGQANDAEEESRPEPVTRASGGGVRFRLVNGVIVEDTDSLTIDRAARVAEAVAQDVDAAVEEENDLTRRLNRTTWINARKRDETERVPQWKSKSAAWNEEDTDKFYEALRMFGTDFFVISQLFEGRTRRMIKLKFVREERIEPDRINAALLGQRTSKIDLGQYAQAIGKDQDFFDKYDSLAHANETIRESFKDKEEAMRAAVKEDEENNRQREHQRQHREKQRLEAEKKKDERARKKDARRRGDVWGAGTLAAADDDVMDGID